MAWCLREEPSFVLFTALLLSFCTRLCLVNDCEFYLSSGFLFLLFFVTPRVFVLYLQCAGWLIGVAPCHGGAGDQTLLEFFIYSLY